MMRSKANSVEKKTLYAVIENEDLWVRRRYRHSREDKPKTPKTSTIAFSNLENAAEYVAEKHREAESKREMYKAMKKEDNGRGGRGYISEHFMDEYFDAMYPTTYSVMQVDNVAVLSDPRKIVEAASENQLKNALYGITAENASYMMWIPHIANTDPAFRFVLGDELANDVEAYFRSNPVSHQQQSTLHLTSREKVEQAVRSQLSLEDQDRRANLAGSMIRAAFGGSVVTGGYLSEMRRGGDVDRQVRSIMDEWDAAQESKPDNPESRLAEINNEISELAANTATLSFTETLRLSTLANKLAELTQQLVEIKTEQLRTRIERALIKSHANMTIDDFKGVTLGAGGALSDIKSRVFSSLPLKILKDIYLTNDADFERVANNLGNIPKGYEAVIKTKGKAIINLDTVKSRGQSVNLEPEQRTTNAPRPPQS